MNNTWAELHSELKNKLRWSIATATQNASFSLEYRATKEWANIIATEIVEKLKLVEEKPNYEPWKAEPSLRLVGKQ